MFRSCRLSSFPFSFLSLPLLPLRTHTTSRDSLLRLRTHMLPVVTRIPRRRAPHPGASTLLGHNNLTHFLYSLSVLLHAGSDAFPAPPRQLLPGPWLPRVCCRAGLMAPRCFARPHLYLRVYTYNLFTYRRLKFS